MKVVVVGAGVIGVTSAWYLNRAGHEVTVIDRQLGPAFETSFANGGQISASHAMPWANPGAPLEILGWLARADAPLAFRPRLDWRQWSWGLRFLRECSARRAQANARRILALARASLEELELLRVETRISYQQRTRGILSIYFEARAFERACQEAEWISREGMLREPRTAAQCVATEPALRDVERRLAGGVFAPADESGDAFIFTQQLAARCARQGVNFRYGCNVRRIDAAAGRIEGLSMMDGAREARIAADAYVVAAGSACALITRPLGLDLPVYPVKGYSVTLPAAPGEAAPHTSLTDEAHKLVFSRLGSRLRVAGTAELAGYGTDIDERRCAGILARVFELFPQAGERAAARYWAGLRPATPGNVPIVCATRYPNLFLNTGHGTLGWTLACGSGRLLANLVSGRCKSGDFAITR